jgi:23S rRNA pseudouridine1911/1915/1917 synthase
LGLTHPETDEFMRWEIELPDDMKQLLELLRDDVARNR